MKILRTLLFIALTLSAAALMIKPLSNIAGPLDYKGYLSFGYPEGDYPINYILFTIDETIATDLIIVNVPTGWSHSYMFNQLTLSQGSLNPGDMVSVQVSLNQYHPSGSYQIESVGTTTAGETSSAVGVLLVGEMYILMFLSIVKSLQYPLFVSAFGLSFVEIWEWIKRGKESEEVETFDPKDIFNNPDLWLDGKKDGEDKDIEIEPPELDLTPVIPFGESNLRIDMEDFESYKYHFHSWQVLRRYREHLDEEDLRWVENMEKVWDAYGLDDDLGMEPVYKGPLVKRPLFEIKGYVNAIRGFDESLEAGSSFPGVEELIELAKKVESQAVSDAIDAQTKVSTDVKPGESNLRINIDDLIQSRVEHDSWKILWKYRDHLRGEDRKWVHNMARIEWGEKVESLLKRAWQE